MSPVIITRLPTLNSDFSITLSWNSTDYNSISRFIIYKNSLPLQLDTNALTDLSYTDNIIAPATDYTYQIYAFNALLTQLKYSISSPTILSSGPNAPSQPNLIKATTNSILFSFQQPSAVSLTTIIQYYRIF